MSLFRGLLIEVLLDPGQIATAHAELATVLAFVERRKLARRITNRASAARPCARLFIDPEAREG